MTVGFLTLAFGRPLYRDMAVALVRSARRLGTSLPFAVVTDHADARMRALFDTLIPYRGELGRGVEQKLHLDVYAPFDRTIFVDADCLFFRSPDEVAARLARVRDFAVCASGYVTREDMRYYGLKDIGTYFDALGIDRFAKFNSGLIAFDKTAQGAAVFAKAREIFAQRERCGLKEFKQAAAPDEPVFAAAIELCGQDVVRDDATLLAVMSDDARSIDEVSAAVVHFNIFQQDSFVYARERYLLALGSFPAASVIAALCARIESVCRRAGAQLRERLLTTVVFPLWGLYRKLFPKKRSHA